MTKSTITREQLLEIIETDHVQCGEASYLARMALAAMDSEPVELPLDYLQGHKDGLEWAAQLAEANHPETGDWLYDDPIELAKAIRKGPDMPPAQPVEDSEPVAWTWHYREQWHVTNDSRRAEFVAKDGDVAVLPLYRHAQPAPVVPEEMTIRDACKFVQDMRLFDDVSVIVMRTWNACRAAMLQAGTITNEGTKQAWTGIPDIDNAINMLDRIDTLESCDDDRVEAVKTVLRRLAGNSPVIPDGYVMMPKEMTDEIGEAISMQARCCGGIALDIYAAILAAAPQSPGSEPATVPGKWIPVSERMPERGDYLVTDGCDFDVQLFNGEQFIPGFVWEDKITHWMPLPAAPQGVIHG